MCSKIRDYPIPLARICMMWWRRRCEIGANPRLSEEVF